MPTRKLPKKILLRINSKPKSLVDTASVYIDNKIPQSSALDKQRPMAKTSADIARENAVAKRPCRSARQGDGKKPPLKEDGSKWNLRNLHHPSFPEPSSHEKDTQLKVRAPTVTKSRKTFKKVEEEELERDSSHQSGRKRGRKEAPEPTPRIAKSRKLPEKNAAASPTKTETPKSLEPPEEGKRRLRSQDPKKLSEIAVLFPEDENQVYIDKNAHILIVDGIDCEDDTESERIQPKEKLKSTQEESSVPTARSAPITTFDFSPFLRAAAKISKDPLTDDMYTYDHRRQGAKEKKWRNIENEKTSQLFKKFQAEYEKLKVMKPSRGETLEEKRRRDHLINCLEVELAKQARYNEELRKLKRSRSEQSFASKSAATSPASSICGDDEDAPVIPPPHPAKGAGKLKRPAPEPEVKNEEKEFTTFFKKPHLKDAALKNYRKSARNAVAFGEPLPAIGPLDFELPDGLVEEAKHARKRPRRE